jgi:methylenetetrahydrofolate--tRNA-(uracil-5-)-methyltransferase
LFVFSANIFFAGQITGVEGYTESASMGIYAALQVFRKIQNKEPAVFPVQTGMGCLVNYIMTCQKPTPSNINFGLLPTLELTKEQRRNKNRKKIKKELVAIKAREVFEQFLSELQ